MITAAINFKKGDVFATDEEKLSVAIAEAHLGMAEGGNLERAEPVAPVTGG